MTVSSGRSIAMEDIPAASAIVKVTRRRAVSR